MATERGKIGRLPEALRAEINAMIRDNKTGAEILAFLEAHGVAGVTPQNISNWKRYGFEKWAARQQTLDTLRETRDFARELIGEAKADGEDSLALASDAANALAIQQLTTAIEGFDPAGLQALLAERPDTFIDVVHALTANRSVEIRFQEFKRKIRAAIDQAAHVADEKGGATADDIKQIFNQAYGV